MANPEKKLFMNFPGPWYVDSTCINCNACRQIAPATFAEAEDYAYVKAQPQTPEERKKATEALISCPTGSIGTSEKIDPADAIRAFPQQIQQNVKYCGFNSRSAGGGNSFLINHPAGNWLIDSPRYHKHLMEKFRIDEGVDFCLFTNLRFLPDSERYHTALGFQRIVHEQDLHLLTDPEVVIRGKKITKLTEDFIMIPVPQLPGGNLLLLYKNRVLFSGKHLWWNPYYQRLDCPGNQDKEIRHLYTAFLKRMMDFPVELIIPSYRNRVQRSAGELNELLDELLRSLAD